MQARYQATLCPENGRNTENRTQNISLGPKCDIPFHYIPTNGRVGATRTLNVFLRQFWRLLPYHLTTTLYKLVRREGIEPSIGLSQSPVFTSYTTAPVICQKITGCWMAFPTIKRAYINRIAPVLTLIFQVLTTFTCTILKWSERGDSNP